MNKPSDILKLRESIIYNKNVKKDIRIASIGDIHLSNLTSFNDIYNITEELYKLKPDYICVLGDLIDYPKVLLNDEKVYELEILMHNIATISPCIVMLGNHDFIDEDIEGYPDVINNTNIWNEFDNIPNINILNDKVYKDNNILFTGYRQKQEAYFNFNLKQIEDIDAYYKDFKSKDYLYKDLPDNIPKVLLTHSPETIVNNKVKNLLKEYDLILTAHYHNGCVPIILDEILPNNIGLITPRKKLFPKYARGTLKQDNRSYIIFNGGWTKISESAPKIFYKLDKLCNREIDITTLTKDEKYKKEHIKSKKLVLEK